MITAFFIQTTTTELFNLVEKGGKECIINANELEVRFETDKILKEIISKYKIDEKYLKQYDYVIFWS